MDRQALLDEIRHEVEVNPVVELEGSEEMPLVSSELAEEKRSSERQEDEQPEDDSNPLVNYDEEAAERRQRFFDRQVAEESLQEHLIAQLPRLELSETERQLAELIIGDIDDDGRYVGSFEELSQVLGVATDMIEGVLARIQLFDPPGVAARTLRECLQIQILQLEGTSGVRELLSRIVDEQLEAVARGEYPQVAKKLGVSEPELQIALKLLLAMEPKPGRPYQAHGRQVQYIWPEVKVEVEANDLIFTPLRQQLPSIRINQYYQDMLASPETPSETRNYLKERVASAEQLGEAIVRRGETVLRVAETVFSIQRDFFKSGFESLKPLTIEEVARRTGYHGTTVGRAVRGKYVETPRGVYELKRFFCVGRLAQEDGNGVSAVSVKRRLSLLTRSESGYAMTDDELVKALNEEGVKISRRTVAKYRSQLGIPAAAERKRRAEA